MKSISDKLDYNLLDNLFPENLDCLVDTFPDSIVLFLHVSN